jgi:tRNA C32,U32 (ribose-2'-O)-methylase TrmJ
MNHVRVVLVRPQIAGNIGAVARCMENFDAGQLVLVEPKVSPTSREALQRSTHGEHRLHSARVVSSLAEALEGCAYAIGASRRPGPVHQAEDLAPRDMGRLVARKIDSREGIPADEEPGRDSRLSSADQGPGRDSRLSSADEEPGEDSRPSSANEEPGRDSRPSSADEEPGEDSRPSSTDEGPGRDSRLSSKMPVPHPHDVALLFGSEDNGLSREDLLSCDAVVVIPANPDYPTMNLSHAVAVCLYEAFLAVSSAKHTDATVRKHSQPADLALMSRLMDKLQHALLTIGYLHPEKPDHLMFPIRAILSRAELSRAEAQILMGLAQQIDEFARYGKRAEDAAPQDGPQAPR